MSEINPATTTDVEAVASTKPLPKPARVAKAKNPSAKDAQNAAIEKKLVDSSPKRDLLKTPYNFRVRSLARTLVDALEDEDAKKQLRAALKEAESYGEIRRKALALLIDEAQWEQLLEVWFAAGVKGS